jgi:hypothetical protein
MEPRRAGQALNEYNSIFVSRIAVSFTSIFLKVIINAYIGT